MTSIKPANVNIFSCVPAVRQPRNIRVQAMPWVFTSTPSKKQCGNNSCVLLNINTYVTESYRMPDNNWYRIKYFLYCINVNINIVRVCDVCVYVWMRSLYKYGINVLCE